jgi:hypothetical protein
MAARLGVFGSEVGKINFSLIKRRIQRGESSDLGFFGPCFSFLHASTAARLIKKAHNSQDRGRGDDDPFGPRGWPPKYGQDNYGRSQQKPTETEFHDFPSFFIEATQSYRKVRLYSKAQLILCKIAGLGWSRHNFGLRDEMERQGCLAAPTTGAESLDGPRDSA